jgi:hypothetical protein
LRLRKSFAGSLFVSKTLQRAIGIATAIKHTNDHDFGIGNLKDNGRAAFEADRPQSLADIVSARSTFQKCGERHAGGFDSIYVIAGDGVPGLGGDMIIAPEKVSFRLWAKTDGKLHFRAAFICLA